MLLGPADYFPWTGHQVEDVLSEQVTRNGFHDKPQTSHIESSIIRSPLWTNVKNKAGLNTLSSVFVSALDQRQGRGEVPTTSTFKPPPRVTLTDAKREAWLRDLANPCVPLRRLSRTIPHGIRGKILLDQCISKEIPITRAIWLIKCVGANEIRAFKRKGTSSVLMVGSETKWIKDWTLNVEQFQESIITAPDNQDRKSSIEYR